MFMSSSFLFLFRGKMILENIIKFFLPKYNEKGQLWEDLSLFFHHILRHFILFFFFNDFDCSLVKIAKHKTF